MMWLYSGSGYSLLALELDFIHYSPLGAYTAQFDTGPAWMLPAALFRTSPFLFVAAFAGFVAALYRALRSCISTQKGVPWGNELGLELGIAFYTYFTLLLLLFSHRFNLRYTAPAFASICLLAGIGVNTVLPHIQKLRTSLGRATAWTILGCVISIAALRDLHLAQTCFLPQMGDLTLRQVLNVPPLPWPSGLQR
jgi:hypothetical protein